MVSRLAQGHLGPDQDLFTRVVLPRHHDVQVLQGLEVSLDGSERFAEVDRLGGRPGDPDGILQLSLLETVELPQPESHEQPGQEQHDHRGHHPFGLAERVQHSGG